MTKWKCVNNNGCPSKCEIETTSTGKPTICPFDWNRTRWEEIENVPGETFYFCDEVDDAEEKMKRMMPENKLPDWCKVGEWVWLDPQKITGANGYEKVTNVDGLGLMFESGLMVGFLHRILQARLRPWTKEEAIGKVVKNACCVGIITYADKFKCIVGTKVITLKELSEEYTEQDGAPCGKLEHLDDAGEWEA